MRKLIALLLCLAFVAGLLVSCSSGPGGGAAGEVPENSATNSQLQSREASDPNVSGDQTNIAAGSSGDQRNSAVGSSGYSADPGSSASDVPGALPDDIVLGGINLSAVLRSARITGTRGKYTFSFEHPQIPENQHLTVSLRIYEEGREGDLLIESYDSDGIWMAEPEDYDPSARQVTQELNMSGTLDDKYVLVSVKCFEPDSYNIESDMAMRDYDGLVTEEYSDIFAWSN